MFTEVKIRKKSSTCKNIISILILPSISSKGYHCILLVSGISLYPLCEDWMAAEHHFPELIQCFLFVSLISVDQIKETMKNSKGSCSKLEKISR